MIAVVRKPFILADTPLKFGDLVDTDRWRNGEASLKTGVIRPATADELVRYKQGARSILAPAPEAAPAAPAATTARPKASRKAKAPAAPIVAQAASTAAPPPASPTPAARPKFKGATSAPSAP
jgi:hypothetical protein